MAASSRGSQALHALRSIVTCESDSLCPIGVEAQREDGLKRRRKFVEEEEETLHETDAVAAYPAPCSRCAARSYSSAAAGAASTSPAAPTSSTSASSSAPPPTPAPAPAAYVIRSGLILTRPPLLTRRLHPFENAFFFYQKRLEERLNTPFITSIYFKPDTAAQLDWDIKVRGRGGAVARELGGYHGKGSAAWDDELRVGDALSSSESLLDSLLADAAPRVSDDAEVIAPEDVVAVERPQARRSAADDAADVRRLDREMDRTLYLVVKGQDGWCFPADVIPEGENLHECAQRVLDHAAGVNMNTWIVGRVPVAHVVRPPVLAPDGAVRARGSKTFLLKGRIMAGQADLKGNTLGYTDFRWLTREELEALLAPEYFKGVRNMMADR